MPLVAIPNVFQQIRPLEQALYGELEKLPDEIECKIRISPNPNGDASIRSAFLRWFLLEAIPSSALAIANVEIEKAVIEDILDLEAVTTNLLLRFVECKFSKGIDLSDATVIGFEMIGGSAPEIAADRLTVKGSMRLLEQYKPQPIKGPCLGMLRLCGADIRGNLDMRGCTLRMERENAKEAEIKSATDTESEEKTPADKNRVSPTLFADGLTVHGNVMLSGGFNSDGEIRLNGCNVGRNLDCSGATLSNPGGYSLSAAGAHVTGSAYFCQTQGWLTYPREIPFTSKGALRLEGAVIDGDLDCSGGSFTATAFLSEHSDQTTPAEEDLYAIVADGLKVGSDIQCGPGTDEIEKFAARGIVSLINARVGGDFSCLEAQFYFPGEEPLSADGIVVEGTTFLDGIVTDGMLRFVQADLKQGFYISSATFDPTKGCKSWTKDQSNIAAAEVGGPSCGIYAPNAEIGGVFRWKGVTKRKANIAGETPANRFWLFIPGSKANSIEDDESSWSELDEFEITGCQYDTVADLSDVDVDWRLRELDRRYARLNIEDFWPDATVAFIRIYHGSCRLLPARIEPRPNRVSDTVKQFKPQPYIQLARTFRAAGYEAAAHKVLVRLERNKTRYSDIGFFRQFWRYMLDIFLRYGYAPFRPVLIVATWAVVSAAFFQSGYDSKQIIASKDNQAVLGAGSSADPRVPFNAIVYAVDTLVPIVDLSQKKNWTVAKLSSLSGGPDQRFGWCKEVQRVWQTIPNQPLGILLIFNTFFGWLMTTLFAAGVSGLLRTGKDS